MAVLPGFPLGYGFRDAHPVGLSGEPTLSTPRRLAPSRIVECVLRAAYRA